MDNITIADVMVRKTTKETMTAIEEALKTHNRVELHFGHVLPDSETLEAIAYLWKKRRVTISVINDWDFKRSLDKLKKYAYGDKYKANK